MLIYPLIFLTFIMLAAAMWHAYSITRDPLHPLMYLVPLCAYSYVVRPVALGYLGALDQFLDPRQLLYVQIVNMLGLAALCMGAIHHARQVTRVRVSLQAARVELERMLTPAVRQRVLEIAWIMGGVAVGAYWLMIFSSGGLSVVYGQAKGGVVASTGYINEMQIFCLSAIGLLYLAWAGQRFTFGRIAALIVVASPMVVHGLLGARRGPTFMGLGALLIGGYLVTPRRPRLTTVVTAVLLLGVFILFLVNNRDRIYIGGSAIEEWAGNDRRNVPQGVTAGDDWIFSGGTILTSSQTGNHFWGTRILVNLLVHPIPKQLWPNKYADTGFGWMENHESALGMTENEWVATVGWLPTTGAAAGFVADLYLEFWWLGLIACWLLGWTYSWLWRGMVLHRGVWSIIYLYAAILSIFVPTQNVTDAWLYRMALLSLPTIALWRWLVHPVLAGNPAKRKVPQLSSLVRKRVMRPNRPISGGLNPS